MKKLSYLALGLSLSGLFFQGCSNKPKEQSSNTEAAIDTFKYEADKFADLKILRYKIPGFEALSPKEKEQLYYLYQAALSGRDIFYDQNYRHNLTIRRTMEAIISNYTGDKKAEEYVKLEEYAKRVFYSNGVHHHYGNEKIVPSCSQDFFKNTVKSMDASKLPLKEGETVEAFITRITPIIFDPKLDAKKVNKAKGVDMITGSAVNFYEGVTAKEVEDFYKSMEVPGDTTPIWYGLNSKVVKENGKIVEKTWKVGGMYSAAIEKIVFWLEKAIAVTDSKNQKAALEKLVEYYKTGDLRKFDEYNILWVKDTDTRTDVVNGFIEVYDDPIGKKGSFESVVSFRDEEASKRIAAIASQAQWFEDNSPIAPEHKKKDVVGISAKVITTVVESGGSAPSTPIGINLPNADWVRKMHGSKSVNLGNIVDAYNAAPASGMLEEFCFSPEEVTLAKAHNVMAGKLHTDMHEVIGHASGQINKGIGSPKETLKNYASTLEEARADLVALYYILDQKLVDMKVMSTLDVGKAEYDGYIRNGLVTQLVRIEEGKDIEEDHMRNRQLVAKWAFEKGAADKVIEKKTKDGKTYFVINDYNKLRGLFGQLLKEIQRIKSEGDFKSAQELVENYGVKVDAALHKEVLERYKKLNDKPYKGFIQPRLVPVTDASGKITDVKVEYPNNFLEQMLYYGKEYSFLPNYN
ncbi:MAG: dipeptidyl peptidase 3 [Bacteroidia bacterium]|nr:dipeptidyl peptidase 3 [Bacteroidia bacterium]